MVPPGSYLLTLGIQTVLQWFDPLEFRWRVFASGGELKFIASDGGNFRLVNFSGIVQASFITNAGSGGTNGIGPTQTGSTVSFAAPVAGITATGYAIVGGSVAAPTITAAGSGFLVPPLILIDAPPAGGIQAKAVATIVAGAITAITMTDVGAGYLVTPNFYILPQPQYYQGAPLAGGALAAGAYPPPGLVSASNPMLPNQSQQPYVVASGGALLTPVALTGSGTLTGIIMTSYGTGYDGTHIPAITLAGTSLGAAAATAVMAMCVTSVPTTGTAGVAYTVGSPWITALGLIVTQGSPLLPRRASGKINATTGFTGTAATIEDPGFALQSVPNAQIVGGLPTTASTTTLVCGGVSDNSFLQPAVD